MPPDPHRVEISDRIRLQHMLEAARSADVRVPGVLSAVPSAGAQYDFAVNTEIVFIVEQHPDGGFTAHAVGSSIFTQGDTPEQLRENVRDAVRCHFADSASRPEHIRLRQDGDEVMRV